MRQVVVWLGGLAALVILAGSGSAQDAKDATVRATTAEVRGGRSEVFPITGYLRQGQAVRVVGEDGPFCAIVPPPGSLNWIEDHAVKPIDNGGRRPDKAYVLIHGVSVRLGSDRSPSPLPYETVTLNRGTIVKIVGDKAFAEGKEWWPIQPPPADVRYVAKESLSQPTTTVASATPATSVALKPGGNSPTNPLWGQAQQAEQVHDYARAELLYRQLAGEMAQPGGDHDLAIRCYNRIEQLARAQTATWPARQQAPGMLVSSRAVSATSPPSAAAPPSGSISSGPGWLRRTGIYLEGKPAYVLEDNRGQPRYYVLAAPGQNLDYYLNRAVEVTGPLVSRPDFVSGGYISVYRVALLR